MLRQAQPRLQATRRRRGVSIGGMLPSQREVLPIAQACHWMSGTPCCLMILAVSILSILVNECLCSRRDGTAENMPARSSQIGRTKSDQCTLSLTFYKNGLHPTRTDLAGPA